MPIELIAKIVPKNDSDFSMVEDIHLEGGFQTVADLTARNAIPVLRRKEGMHVYVISENDIYKLVGGIDNTDWVLFAPGGTETLDETLALGNFTGGEDIEVTIGDSVRGENAAGGSGLDGGDLTLTGGAGDGVGLGGDVVLTGGTGATAGTVRTTDDFLVGDDLTVTGDILSPTVSGDLTMVGNDSITGPSDVTFELSGVPSTGPTESAVWASDGAAVGLNAGELYVRAPNDGPIYSLQATTSVEKVVLSFTCTATEQVGDVVYLSADDTVAQAQSNAIGTTFAVGLIISKPSVTSCDVVVAGKVEGLAGLTAGTRYYLSNTVAGGLLATPPITSGHFVIKVGIAINTTDLLLQIDPPVLLT